MQAMTQEPSINDLLICYQIAKAIGDKTDLERIRNRRYTWFGPEIKVRVMIDNYLRTSG